MMRDSCGAALPRSADVVIVGGGAIGSAVAYFLAGDPDFGGVVLVVERDPSYTTASTTLSASSLRLQFSTPENVAMSSYGADFLREAPARFAVDGVDVPLAIESCPYLTLAGERDAAALTTANDALRDHGVAVRTLTTDELADRWPWMALDGIASAALGPDEEGVFDGTLLHDSLRRAAVARGARFAVGDVVGLTRTGNRITTVELADGHRVACGSVVNAAGPHARSVAQMVGVDLPVSPRKRCLFVFDSPEPAPDCPIVVDGLGGIAFRPEGTGFLTTLSRLPAGRDEETTSLTVEFDLFDDYIWPALAARAPGFDHARRTSAWAGLYEVNVHDHNAIIGPHPGLTNFLLCNGFSGHGLQHAPAAGLAVSELIVDGAYRTLDLSALSFERLLDTAARDEARVI